MRFCPLLAVALGIFIVGKAISVKTAFLALTGLSCFIAPMPLTLWFFSMIVLFYWLTPLICFGKNATWKSKFAISVGIYIAFWIITLYIHPMDERVLRYFPWYIAGILFPLNKLELFGRYRYQLLVFTIGILTIGYYCDNQNVSICLYAVGGGILFYLLR